jgi:hypothetical protein
MNNCGDFVKICDNPPNSVVTTFKKQRCKKCQGKINNTLMCIVCKTQYFRNFHGKLIEVKK